MTHMCRRTDECGKTSCPHHGHHDYRNQGKYLPEGQQGMDVDMCDAPCDVSGGLEGATCVQVEL